MKGAGTRRLVKGVVAALAAALLAVPVAQARLAVDARHAALLNREPAVQVDQGSKIVQMHRHAARLNLTQVGSSTPVASTGMDWQKVGIGASAGFALVLLVGGSLLVTRRRLVGA